MRMITVCLIILTLVCIFVQSCAAQSRCTIMINDGKAAGAFVEVYDGDQRVFWGPTNSRGECYPDLIQGKAYNVRVKWQGRDITTNIIANCPVNVRV